MAKKAKPAETPREGVNTRITRELRDKLDAAAAQSGRSVGSEIERRLERSFSVKAEILELFQDEATSTALSAIALSWYSFKIITNRDWYEDVSTLLTAQAAAQTILSHFKSLSGESISGASEKISPEEVPNIISLGALLGEVTRDRIKNRPGDKALPSAVALAETVFGLPQDRAAAPKQKNSRQKTQSA